MSVRGASQRFTWTLFLAMALSMGLVPMLRAFTRQICSKQSWWGTPAIIFGAGPAAETVIRTINNDPGMGLKAVAAFDEDTYGHHEFANIPVMRLQHLHAFVKELKRPAYAVFAMPDIPQERLAEMIETYAADFSHVLVLPDIKVFSSLWVDSKSVGGMLGLEVRQQLVTREYQVFKRLIDMTLIALGSILVLPVCAAIALLIFFDSPGPVLYSQWRIGRKGRKFRAWKFRSMVPDADQILHEHLAVNPGMREEWARDQKLRHDPRITRSGRFLRRSSLDELPQLWNVLMGDMSLVGPRPIVEKEAERYGRAFETYKRVKGGITGLWQVSGRNDLSYAERVDLDQFYVRNWSVWLDFCILFRTIAVVLLNKGAY
jgi:Undecaprenyl-phosphate galactose phosphotransferase WbaP